MQQTTGQMPSGFRKARTTKDPEKNSNLPERWYATVEVELLKVTAAHFKAGFFPIQIEPNLFPKNARTH